MPQKVVHYGLIWAVLTALFLWPAWINGGLIFNPDTFAYLNGPRTALEVLTGTGALPGFAEPAAIAGAAPEPYSGRSIYFGFVVFALISAFGLWGPPVFQAGLTAAVLVVALRPFSRHRKRLTIFAGLVVAGLTAAPFYASLLMPDYLAGLMILAALRLQGLPDRPGRYEAGFLWLVTAFAAMSHTGLAILLAVLIVLARLTFPLFRQTWHWKRANPLIGAVFLAAVLEMFFTAMVVEVYGQKPLRPPFLTARMVADGPGTALLRERCDADRPPFAVCAFADRLPVHSQVFLWERDPERGIWAVASPAVRRAMSEQDFTFARAVIAAHPLAQARASLARTGEQLRWFGLEDIVYSRALKRMIDDWWSGAALARVQATGFYRGTMPVSSADALYKIAALASFAHLAALAVLRRRLRPGADPGEMALAAFAVLIFLGLVANAAIHGALSAPAPRYQGRVIWLLPMLSALIVWREVLADQVAAFRRSVRGTE